MISRRGFFAQVAGAVAAARVVPSGRLAAAAARLAGKPVWGSIGGARVGSITGSLMGYPIVLSDADFPVGDVRFGDFTPRHGEAVTFKGEWDDA
jgi:hypothetical protein